MTEKIEALRLVVAYCETQYIEPRSDLWEALIVMRRMIGEGAQQPQVEAPQKLFGFDVVVDGSLPPGTMEFRAAPPQAAPMAQGLTPADLEALRDAVDDLDCELSTRYQGYPQDDRRRVRDFAVVSRARAILDPGMVADSAGGVDDEWTANVFIRTGTESTPAPVVSPVYDTSVVKRIATQMGWTPPGASPAALTDEQIEQAAQAMHRTRREFARKHGAAEFDVEFDALPSDIKDVDLSLARAALLAASPSAPTPKHELTSQIAFLYAQRVYAETKPSAMPEAQILLTGSELVRWFAQVSREFAAMSASKEGV